MSWASRSASILAGVGLVLGDQLDQLRGQVRQPDEVAEDRQRSPLMILAGLEAGHGLASAWTRPRR